MTNQEAIERLEEIVSHEYLSDTLKEEYVPELVAAPRYAIECCKAWEAVEKLIEYGGFHMGNDGEKIYVAPIKIFMSYFDPHSESDTSQAAVLAAVEKLTNQ